MKKRILSFLLALVMAVSCLPTGALHAHAQNGKTVNEEMELPEVTVDCSTLNATYEYAWFPAPQMAITQIAYESYSHGNQNAIDFAPGGNVFAPFTGKITYLDSSWGYVVLQSSNKVYYADGTLDYMTVTFMHDESISNLSVGQVLTQGTAFYQAGGMGYGNPDKYPDHVHLAVYKGHSSATSNYGAGNVYAFDAFYVNSAKTTKITNQGQMVSGNYMTNGAPSNWNGRWINLTSRMVTYHPNGGTCATEFVTVEKGKTIGTMPTPTLNGYSFAGWYTQPFGGSAVTSSTVVNENMTVYARWQRAGNYVKFNLNGGDALPEVALSDTIDGVNIGRPGESLVVFNKGGTIANSNIYGAEVAVDAYGQIVATRDYGDEQQLTVPNGGFVLSGQAGWDDATSSTVGGSLFVWEIFDLDEAYVSLDYETGVVKVFDCYDSYLADNRWVISGNAIGQLPTPTRTGYIFTGWYTSKTGGTKYTSSTTVNSGITLYAQWESLCSHSYSSKVTTAATCTKNGVRTYTCSKCSDSYTETIKSLGHKYSSQVIPATCQDYEKVRYTCSACGDTYEEYTTTGMTDWTTTKPSGVDASLIETKTQYRYNELLYTTSTDSTLSGWTQFDSYTQWSEYGSWSSWGDTAISASDSRQVETRTLYGYYYYECSNCGAHMHGYGTCWTWAGGCGAPTDSSGWTTVWSTTSWDNAGLKDWHGTGKYYTDLSVGRVFQWTDGGTRTQYRSRTRELQTIYCFSRWSGWSSWSDTYIEATEDRAVETRTLYRSPAGVIADHQYAVNVTKHPTTSSAGTVVATCSQCGDSVTLTLPKLNTTDYLYTELVKPTSTQTGTGEYIWKETKYGDVVIYLTLPKLEVSKIEIASNPTKTSYYVGDTLNTSGLKLKVTYSDGTTQTITSGFECTTMKLSTAGTQTITVSYSGKSTSFTVTVTKVAVSSISVESMPTKTTYFVGEELDTSGLKIKVTYNNGTTKTITGSYMYSPGMLNTAGTQTITLTYQGKTTTFTVKVVEVKVSSIAIVSNPTKTTYNLGDTLDTTGLTLKATYNNGTTETITSGFTCTPIKLETAGTQTVTVTYGGKSTSFTVTVEAKAEVDPTAPQLVVEQVTATAGDTVTVDVKFVNNPGFGGMAYDVGYDNSVLELVSYELGLGSNICTDSGVDTYANKVNFQYVSTSNVTGDGTLVTLTFKVKDTAEIGLTEISVKPEAGTVFRYEGRKEIDFTLEPAAGKVTVVNRLPGDVTCDGEVTGKDCAMLLSHVKGIKLITDESVLLCADVTGDGEISGKDCAALLSHVKGIKPLF